MGLSERGKKSLELAIKIAEVSKGYSEDIVLDTCLSIVFSNFADCHSKMPKHSDEYNEHMIMEWIKSKMDSYKTAMALVRSGGIEEYMKKFGGGYEN